MSISNAELIQIYQMTGLGVMPITGGPAGGLVPPIAQTIPFAAFNTVVAASTGVMSLTAIHIPAGQTISNINFLSGSTAESGGSHLWFALYDDGRNSTTASQLALLRQTPDQTGAAAFGATTNLGLTLTSPYTTTYSGIYYIAFMCVGTLPTLVASTHQVTTFRITPGGTTMSFTAGSALTNAAPNPCGAITGNANMFYAYVS